MLAPTRATAALTCVAGTLWWDAGGVAKSAPAVAAITTRPVETLLLLSTMISSLPKTRRA
ncbi:hypothetical protein [Actinoallomurus rhizosphaericola]|uniref:hypothetical protein n=1 Tax=Actinoallomurus rhizosphaericola TaxID=2952536 RepID=UPI0020931C9A|nr:hypothetical protein [Actinoallomurus rhizosphaericola]MCO5997101.1 hypothetical protein [Actinoallomurus rhizosphaericola]